MVGAVRVEFSVGEVEGVLVGDVALVDAVDRGTGFQVAAQRDLNQSCFSDAFECRTPSDLGQACTASLITSVVTVRTILGQSVRCPANGRRILAEFGFRWQSCSTTSPDRRSPDRRRHMAPTSRSCSCTARPRMRIYGAGSCHRWSRRGVVCTCSTARLRSLPSVRSTRASTRRWPARRCPTRCSRPLRTCSAHVVAHDMAVRFACASRPSTLTGRGR